MSFIWVPGKGWECDDCRRLFPTQVEAEDHESGCDGAWQAEAKAKLDAVARPIGKQEVA